MAEQLSLDLTKRDGLVVPERVSMNNASLFVRLFFLVGCRLTFVDAAGAPRSRRRVRQSHTADERDQDFCADFVCFFVDVDALQLFANVLTKIPAGVLAMTRVTHLTLSDNRLVAIPREIGRLTALTHLYVSRSFGFLAFLTVFGQLASNFIAALPREIRQLRALTWMSLNCNTFRSLPSELGLLPSLGWLHLQSNLLTWLPLTLDQMHVHTRIYLNGNPLPIDVGRADGATNSRPKLPELFAATTALLMIREPAFDVLVGLADLDLPALLQVDILDAAFPNSIPMHKKWDLVVAVKHFHQRRGK